MNVARNHYRLASALIAGAVLLLAVSTSRQAGAAVYTSNIEARIKMTNRRLVPGAIVCVYTQRGAFVGWTYSSSRGVAKFTRIPAGAYRVYAYKRGVGTGWGTATIRRGQGPARPTIYLR